MGRAARDGVARNLTESSKIVPLTRVRRRPRLPLPPEPLVPAARTEDSSAELAVEPTRAFVMADLEPAAPLASPGGVAAPRAFRHTPPAERARIAVPGPELTMVHTPDGPAATQFRVLRYRIEAEKGCQVVGITAADRGQGVSSTALNTAIALAEGGRQRVALVDLDLRHGSASRMVGLAGTRGLTELLLQRRASGFGALPMYPVHGTLSLLPAGTQPLNCADMLGSLELSDVVEELRGAFEYVIFDVPAILDFSDASLVHALVDRFVLCARRGADGDRLRRAMARIPRNKVLGAVLVEAPVG